MGKTASRTAGIVAVTALFAGAGKLSLELASMPPPDPFHHREAQAHLRRELPNILDGVELRCGCFKRGMESARARVTESWQQGDFRIIVSALKEALGSDERSIRSAISQMAKSDRVLLSSDLLRLSEGLKPLSAQLSHIAPEAYPYYAPFGTELAKFIDRLSETSRELLSDHAWAPGNICRCLGADISLAP